MFAGFNVNIEEENLLKLDDYYEKGIKLFKKQKDDVYKGLKKYICEDGKTLNGTLMQEDWFPNVNSNIFLSHSHMDERSVISLAGWLHEEFGLTSFIDSCIWGYANDLLKILDEEYSLRERKENVSTYDYGKIMISSSHVHMMLSMALAKMIDKTECLFFINTPNSISVSDSIKKSDSTLSPWIYAELQMSEIIRRKDLKDYRKLKTLLEYNSKYAFAEKELKIDYKVYLGHLTKINDTDLYIWKSRHKSFEYPLDALYVYKGILEEEKAR